jgi:ribonuclease D
VLPDTSIVDAARTPPAGHLQLIKITGFTGRYARRYEKEWLAAIRDARAQGDSELPEPAGGASNGPPPAHRWAERDPAAAARLAAARPVITALSAEYRLPAENLVSPDAVRRLSWEPPQPVDPGTVAGALAGSGARPWQIELAASRLAAALAAAPEQEQEPPELGED